MGLMEEFMEKVKGVKLDQEGLDILNVNARKDSERSRVNVTVTTELGIDFPGDTIENVLSMGFAAFKSGALGNSKAPTIGRDGVK